MCWQTSVGISECVIEELGRAASDQTAEKHFVLARRDLLSRYDVLHPQKSCDLDLLQKGAACCSMIPVLRSICLRRWKDAGSSELYEVPAAKFMRTDFAIEGEDPPHDRIQRWEK